MEYDLHHEQQGNVALRAAAITSDTTTVGLIMDTKDFGGIEFFAFTGDWTDGAFAVIIEHGEESNLSDAETVLASDLLGTPGVLGADDTVARVGYVGGVVASGAYEKRRFVRLSIVSTSTTSGSIVGSLATLGVPKHGPVADQ